MNQKSQPAVKLSPKAEEAFDEIDDCMRMDIKVEPIGALRALREELIRLTQCEQELAQVRDMAACMVLLRQDCIKAGAIAANVPPMFYSEAVLSLFNRMQAAEAECAKLRAAQDAKGVAQ